MRSELVFSALAPMQGRYQLCGLAAKASRKLHTPRNRMQDTLNNVLMLLSQSTVTANDEQTGIKQLRRAFAPSSALGKQRVAQIGHRIPQLGLLNTPDSLSVDRFDQRIRVLESPLKVIVGSRNQVEEHA